MMDLRYVFYYLEMQVDYIIGKKNTLCQSTHLKKVLNYCKITDCKPASILMDLGVRNLLLPHDENTDNKTTKWYQSAIGFFMWPAIYIYRDITYAVRVLSRYYSNLEPTYCNLVIQIFRYLSKTLKLGITFTASWKDKLVGYTDSNYAELIDD